MTVVCQLISLSIFVIPLPLSPAPFDQRKSLWSMGFVLLGFTFFTATMWAGGSVGVAFDFPTILLVLGAGNLLLGIYAAILGYIAARSGLTIQGAAPSAHKPQAPD